MDEYMTWAKDLAGINSAAFLYRHMWLIANINMGRIYGHNGISPVVE